MTFANLDPDAGVPLYRQLRAILENAIAAGQFEKRRLPSARSLARTLGISRNTVNIAYQELVAEGFIASLPRSGFVVNTEMQALITERPLIAAGRRAPGAAGTQSPRWSALIRAAPPDLLPRIEKPSDWHTYPYAFLGGQVGLDVFPSRAWLRSLRAALEPPHRVASLQDSQSLDDPLLVQQLCDHVLPGRGILAAPDEVLVTTGSQQGLYLVAQTLVGDRTPVAVEDPGYPDAAHILLRAGARLLPTPVDSYGLTVGSQLAQAQLICVTPSHHFPTNVTLSIARRQQLLTLVEASGGVIIEDDYDSEFRYQGRPTPALKAMDQANSVVYLGSFSKFLAPGLRLGFVVAAPQLIAELRSRRRDMIRHPPGHLQRALALLIDSGEYARSLRHARSILKGKWQQTVTSIEQHVGWELNPPAGGASLWLTGPSGLDARAAAAAVKKRGVLIEPGDTFFVSAPRPSNHIRLGFASIPLDRIEPGIRVLARELHAQTR